MADGPYSNSARQCFQDLHKAWQGYDVFWKRGNAFDTLLDYIGHHDDAPITAEAMSKEGLDFFNGASKLGMWWDDFGWWGIAFMNAYKLLGAQGGEYLTAAVSCWEEMHKGTLVWEEVEKSPFRSQYTDRQPRFLGGVWNVGMDRTGVWPGPTDCNAFVGIQNTVTNGLFLVLSLRLAATENDTKYLQAAMKVYGWLQQWFKDGLENRELNAVGWPLIEERGCCYIKDPVPLYAKGTVWAGDQGLIMGGLTDLALRPEGGNDPGILELATGISRAVQQSLVDTKGLILPWREPFLGPIRFDTPDYCTGVYVYMRYFLYAQQNWLHEPVDRFSAFLTTNADAVKDPGNVLIAEPACDGYKTKNDMNGLAQRLAILNAADVLL